METKYRLKKGIITNVRIIQRMTQLFIITWPQSCSAYETTTAFKHIYFFSLSYEHPMWKQHQKKNLGYESTYSIKGSNIDFEELPLQDSLVTIPIPTYQQWQQWHSIHLGLIQVISRNVQNSGTQINICNKHLQDEKNLTSEVQNLF